MKAVRVVSLLSAAVLAAASFVEAPALAAPSSPVPGPSRAKAAALHRPNEPSAARSRFPVSYAGANDVVLIVRTDATSRLSGVATAARQQNVKLRRTISALRAVSVQVPAGRQAAVIAHLRALPGVTGVEVAVTRHLDGAPGAPSDPDYPTRQAAYLAAVNAPAAWAVQHGSPGVTIAVVDTGVDVDHPDLSAKIVGAHNVLDGTAVVTDNVGHGTFVAGVAAAATDNGVGVAGAGYDTSLLAVKISDSPGIAVDDEAAGVTWAADHGADVINLSLGSVTSSVTEHNAISYAQGKGVLVVAAAGNATSTTPEYPAAYPGVVAVGATDGTGRASFSNYGAWVTVAAPGANIYSTTPTAGSMFFPAPAEASYSSGDGTSFATPIVAGEAALLKAQDPTASSSTLRSALVDSAHGYSGLGLGRGQVDFGAALPYMLPTTTPTSVTVTGSSAVVSFSATSSAPMVRFQVDGGPALPPVATSGGVATRTWSSWGYPNGAHTVRAADCSLLGQCAAATGSADLDLENGQPIVTSPASGAAVTGGFTITATSPGGGVRFVIDGVRRGFDPAAPYSLAYSGSALSDGPHLLTAVQCATDETVCGGPSSPAVDFSSDSLHPSITGVSPGAFSPNGDKIKDTTTVSFGLPDTETVVLRIVNSSGTIMRGPLSFGTLAAGAHAWIWNGKTNSGHVVPTATYTLKLDTSKVVNGVTVRGAVSRAVGVDVTPPVMSSVTGVGATFYPYPDGYHDTFVPAVTLNEASVLTLVVRNPHGTVRSITVHKPSGRTSVSWNGRDRANRMVAAGTYQWYLKAVDGLANSRTGGVHSLHVSGKRLVAKSAVITENGSSYTSTGAVLGYCSGYSTTRSDFYPYGIWLETECSPAADGFEIVAANYHFRLPAATSYGTMRMQAYGNTVSPPSEIVAGFQRPASNTWDWPGYAKVSSGANHWYSIGSVAAAGHYPSSHVAVIAVGVDNYYGAPSDFDIRYVRLTLSYKVLQ